jgi:hypothetical protein
MAAPGYAYLTLGAARAEMAARLEDPNYVYWTAAELNDLIGEAVRTWQALTATYKQTATLGISPNGGTGSSAFYDLSSLPILSYSVSDQQIINMVLAALLEPPLNFLGSWTGTGQFTFTQITSALQNRINRWLGDTGAAMTRNLEAVATGAPQPIYLPEGVLDVRRAAWIDAHGLVTTLWRDDEYAMQAFHSPLGAFTPAAPPLVWGKYTIPPVGIELYPPASGGSLETLVVASGPQVGTTPAAVALTPTVLGIPENHVWGITFGTLSDLLSADGPARDPERAQYAESRYQESVELYKIVPVLLQTRINGTGIWSGSVFEMDAFLASWQASQGPPQFAAMAGRNLVAFGPVPDSTYTAALDLVANIPVPSGDFDYLQVDRGAIDPLLDYVEHLASFKMGAAEVGATAKLRQNFYQQAALENARITQANFYKRALDAPAMRQQAEVPRT